MTKQIATDSRPDGARPHLWGTPGTFTAVVLGLGSVLGTGVFVSLGIGAQIAGPAVLLGLTIAAVVAVCNGLAIAQLATAGLASTAAPTSTYEYGPRYLNSRLGFSAAWLFLCAKSASAATAALGIAGYVLSAFGVEDEAWRVGLALVAVLIVVAIVLRGGIPWTLLTTTSNLSIAAIALVALSIFILGGLPFLLQSGRVAFEPFFLPASSGTSPLRSVLHASALLFVAYVGYGRIAQLSGEMHRPRRSIPRAIVVTILVSFVLYVGVTAVAIGAVGAGEFAAITLTTLAPLEVIAASFSVPGVGLLIAAGAVVAMLGIVLNLVQTLARLMLTMGRRKDMPNAVARVSKQTHVPEMAVIAAGILISLLVLIGNVRITWELSAFTILIYYAITNLAALQVAPDQRLYPNVIPAIGLLSCLFLAFWLDPGIWLAGIAILVGGHGWRWIMRRL